MEELYDDLYTTDTTNPAGRSMLSNLFQSIRRSKTSLPSAKNLGVPSETYLTLTPLNPMYQSYDYSFTAATESKAKAAAMLRTQNFNQALKRAVDSTLVPLTPAECIDLFTEEKAFLKQGKDVMESIRNIQQKITSKVIDQEMDHMDVQVGEVDPYPLEEEKVVEEEEEEEEEKEKEETEKSSKKKITKNMIVLKNSTTRGAGVTAAPMEKSHEHRVSEMSWWKNTWNGIFPGKEAMAIEKLITELEEENSNLVRLELEFIRTVVEIMGPVRHI